MGSQTAATPKGTPGAAPANPLIQFMPLVFFAVVLYFMVFRPTQKQRAEHKRMIDNLKPGDKVVTQGGIVGTVASVKLGVIQLKIAENVKVDVMRSFISEVMTETANGVVAAPVEKA